MCFVAADIAACAYYHRPVFGRPRSHLELVVVPRQASPLSGGSYADRASANRPLPYLGIDARSNLPPIVLCRRVGLRFYVAQRFAFAQRGTVVSAAVVWCAEPCLGRALGE